MQVQSQASHNSHNDYKPKLFCLVLAFLEILILVLHAIFSDYRKFNLRADIYPQFQDVNVMIFVGFGFLMTVMRKFSYSALCFTFLIGAISFQLHPLFTMLFETAYHKAHYHIAMSIELLILASFCAGSILIAFGGIIGKVTPFQLVVMVFLQTIVYTLNENICLYMGVADIGGSMVIHEFGAFFGLTVSFLITPLSAKNNPAAESSYASDVTSMIGTVFLWMYWPSFNGALADPLSERANRAFVNTILGISASCVSGFMFSSLWREDGKLKMVDIQNATLAGGVALGTIADMRIIPVVAILVGGFAGFVSTFGFAKLQPFLEKKIGLHDSCGILNLHGLPSLIGAIAGAIVAASSLNGTSWKGIPHSEDDVLSVFSKSNQIGWNSSWQGARQIYFALISLAMAIVGGIITGVIMRKIGPKKIVCYEDEEYWEIPKVLFGEKQRLRQPGDKNEQ